MPKDKQVQKVADKMNLSETLDKHLSFPECDYFSFIADLTKEYGSGFKPHFDVVDGDPYKSISGLGGTGSRISEESPDKKPKQLLPAGMH